MGWRQLSDEQWEKVEKYLPKHKISKRGGRPRANNRNCFEGILWILWTGSPWSELPEHYGSPTTCWRRLKEWEENGILLKLWRAFLSELDDSQKLDWDECFGDGSFAPAKKGAKKSGKPSVAREQSGWFWSMARVLRLEHTWSRRHQQK